MFWVPSLELHWATPYIAADVNEACLYMRALCRCGAAVATQRGTRTDHGLSLHTVAVDRVSLPASPDMLGIC